MSDRRVWPEDIAPPGFLRDEGAPEARTTPPAPTDPMVEPAPDRPEVIYSVPGGRTHVITLQYPVEIAGVFVDRVTVHPPALWDIQDWAARRLRTNYEIMARMCDMDPVALGALRWPDIDELSAVCLRMLPEAMRELIEASKQA